MGAPVDSVVNDALLGKLTNRGLAAVCHNVNKAYCAALGDLTQKPFIDAPEWQQKSAVAGVEFHLANPEAGPEASHESWLKGKVADGWKYGPVKREDWKEHPCVMPYGDLPAAQQAKDFIFKAVVEQLRPFLTKPVTSEVVDEA